MHRAGPSREPPSQREDGLLVDVEMPRSGDLGGDLGLVAEGQALPPRGEAILAGLTEIRAMAFNRNVCLERLGGDLELLGTAVETFLAEAPDLRMQIRQSVDRKDGKALCLVAHSIKGMALTLEALPLAAEARRLELLGRDGDFHGARQALRDFEREMERLVEALRDLEMA